MPVKPVPVQLLSEPMDGRGRALSGTGAVRAEVLAPDRTWQTQEKFPLRVANTIPASAGIGLRAQHYREIVESRPVIGWLEIHSENYFGDGGQPLFFLEQLRRHYPVSLHGVGLSLGSMDPLNVDHLKKLKSLITRYEPGLVSEHLCWSSIGGRYLNDLLPLPYTEEALAHVVMRIMQTQDFLQRQILVENVSSYVQYRHSTIPEWEFVAEVARRAGCGILLDVNNIYVNAVNQDFDPLEYLSAIPKGTVQELHLAGFAVNRDDDTGNCPCVPSTSAVTAPVPDSALPRPSMGSSGGRGEILIDHHGAPVAEPVWALYREALQRFGPIPTLIEWDTDIPPLPILLAEARQAETLLEQTHARLA